jgi:hypothetical protein
MDFCGDLNFKGDRILHWVKRQEDGSVELLFDLNGRESSLTFSKGCFEKIIEAVKELLIGKSNFIRTAENTEIGKGKISLGNIIIDLEDEAVVFSAEEETELQNRIPLLIIFSKDKEQEIGLMFNPKQAKELHHRLGKALEAQAAYKEVIKEKIIQPSVARVAL